MLRARDLNIQQQETNHLNLKGAANKHKATDELKDGPTRAKRAAVADVTKALSTTFLDSTKKRALKRPFVESPNVIDEFDESYDYDKESTKDPFAVSEYAHDIFRYFKWRERAFMVSDYVRANAIMDPASRATVVDWLVEIQENFEMNHETMYMAVKLMDMYFSRQEYINHKSSVQLIACAAIFVSAKMEERAAPLMEDLIYMCRTSFTESDLKRMERELLKVVGFDLCGSLSYTFLRRYGRVIKADMHLLTTARFILELSLHFLCFCRVSESKIAAAAMLLALRVTKQGDWNNVLTKYSGYTLFEVEPLMWSLNHMVRRFENAYPRFHVVLNKYAHPVFFEVAKQDFLTDRHPAKQPIGPPTADIMK